MDRIKQEALQLLPLINNLEAYEAFVAYLDQLHKQYYELLVHSSDDVFTFRNQGKLQLIDEMKQLRDRLKDLVKNGRPEPNSSFL